MSCAQPQRWAEELGRSLRSSSTLRGGRVGGSGCDKKPPGGGPGKWSGDQLLAEAVWCVL